jgi:gliding motility-associated-like protein
VNLAPVPAVDLGPDIILEPGQTVQLDAGENFQSYLWQDGSIGRYFDVGEDGIYWVTVWNELCQASDTILVNKQDCEASLFIPNCFTPNGDGFNEEFLVVAENLITFEMLIFNRWGQLLFETSDINTGWNGKVNGVLSPQGTYYYLVKFTTDCIYGLESSGVRKGSATLLE